MLGAVIGDIVGSRFEFNNRRSKDFELFTSACFFTDDSVMTLALAQALMDFRKRFTQASAGQDFTDADLQLLSELSINSMQSIGRRYPNCGYGGMFGRWVFDQDPQPYHSYGNGAAMRVSPVSFFARSEDQVKQLARAVTGVTHNHPEGLKGAEAAAMAIFLARQGCTKREIRERIARDYYPLDFTIDQIRPTYQFNETCQETVPQAIVAFLESQSFGDAVRTAISLGGDSDTLGAITGAIAEAYYGVPDELREQALSTLDADLRDIYDQWEQQFGGSPTCPC